MDAYDLGFGHGPKFVCIVYGLVNSHACMVELRAVSASSQGDVLTHSDDPSTSHCWKICSTDLRSRDTVIFLHTSLSFCLVDGPADVMSVHMTS